MLNTLYGVDNIFSSILLHKKIMGHNSIKIKAEEAGNFISDNRIVGRIATSIIINDASKNLGFKTELNKVIFTDTTTISINDVVTINFE